MERSPRRHAAAHSAPPRPGFYFFALISLPRCFSGLVLTLGIAACLPGTTLFAADVAPGATQPNPGSNSLIPEPADALRQLSAAPGLQISLFAAEPDVRNPVALDVDPSGRVYVVESDRRRSSVFDIRGHREWLDADFSFRTVADRANFLRREVVPENKAVIERLTKGGRGDFRDFNQDRTIDWRDLEVQSERIRELIDSDGDGRADRVSIFADGFTNIVAGVAAGVLARRDEVFFACIPDLWRISRSVDNPSRSRPLISGFGVHVAFGGHDMHGLVIGPDGRLYWSIADRGTDTNLFATLRPPPPGLTPELLADSGCVFRANLDGSGFEVVAWGLRNPQELAFDDAGNLFTADNNGDGGDKARWHQIVEGADFGWRLGWQWLEARPYQPKMGPWNGERLWHLSDANTAAWLLPPLAHIGHGPAGLAFNPGTGLPPRWNQHFFLCDFPGSVLAWNHRPNGATFTVGPITPLVGELGPTDIAFHPAGGLLVTDWFKTFDKTDKGRIYRVHDPATDASPAVAATRELLAADPVGATVEALTARLAHVDRRIRSEAQSELARRARAHADARLAAGATPAQRTTTSPAARSALLRVAHDPAQPLAARRHAIWGLGEAAIHRPFDRLAGALGLANPRSTEAPLDLLADPDDDVRAAAWMTVQWAATSAVSSQEAARWLDQLTPRLNAASNPRHRALILAALGRLASLAPGSTAAAKLTTVTLEALPSTPRTSPDSDRYLRHAAAHALAQAAQPSLLTHQIAHASAEVRLTVLLALRQLGNPAVARFLDDANEALVLEAARAIHDVPIGSAYPALADRLARPGTGGELEGFTIRRALTAAYRLGQPQQADALARWAAQSNAPGPLRLEALERLAQWAQPPGRDPLLGLWRPLPNRPPEPAARALEMVLPGLLRDPQAELPAAAFRTARALGLRTPVTDPFTVLTQRTHAVGLRVEALQALASDRDPRLAQALTLAESDPAVLLRVEATRLQPERLDPAGIAKTLVSGTLIEQQTAMLALGVAPIPAASRILADQLDALLAGRLKADLALDLLEAASRRNDSSLRQRLQRYTNSLPKNEPLARWRATLHGGDPAAGRVTFYENQQIACFRCHKLHGDGGDVGPDLTGLGERRGREYLLESILLPNNAIAPGYENALITMKNGMEFAGLVKSETDSEVELNSPEDGLMRLKKSEIASRRRGLSAMPEDIIQALTARELRDLIAFLAEARAGSR